MSFRRLLILLTAILLAMLPTRSLAAGSEVTIVRVIHEWRDAASFKRIAEYFDGREHHGSAAIRRSHPESRSGYYYFVRVHNPGALRPATASLEVITSASALPVRYQFPVELKGGDTVFNIGLTGADWPGAAMHPVAWKLEFLDAEGRALAARESYLWEKPAAE